MTFPRRDARALDAPPAALHEALVPPPSFYLVNQQAYVAVYPSEDDVLAYAFQSKDIAQALIAAHQRGVEVRIVVDKKRNQGKTSQAAMRLVVSNGVQLRTNDHFHIHHDKAMIVDGDAVETGSFNYAPSAETVNSENVVVIRGMPEVSRQFIAHWQSRWELGVPYLAR